MYIYIYIYIYIGIIFNTTVKSKLKHKFADDGVFHMCYEYIYIYIYKLGTYIGIHARKNTFA